MGAACCRVRVQDTPETERLQEQLRISRSERTDSHNRHETDVQRLQEEMEKEVRERMSKEQHVLELKTLRRDLENQLNVAKKEKQEYHLKAEEYFTKAGKLQEEVEMQRRKAVQALAQEEATRQDLEEKLVAKEQELQVEVDNQKRKAVQALAQEDAFQKAMENKQVAKDQELRQLEMVKEDIMRLQNELASERKKSRPQPELISRKTSLPLSFIDIIAYKYFMPKRDIKIVATKKNRFVSQCIIAYLPANRQPVVQYGIYKDDWKERKVSAPQVLLPITWHENLPNFAGGASDNRRNETPERTAIREYQEEMGSTGLRTGQFFQDDLLFATVQQVSNNAGGKKDREVTTYFYGKVIRQYEEYLRHCSNITNGKGFISEVYGFVSLPIWYEIEAKTNKVFGLPKYLANTSLFTSYTLCDFLVVLLCLRLVNHSQLNTIMALAQRLRQVPPPHDHLLTEEDFDQAGTHNLGPGSHGGHSLDPEPSILDQILNIDGLRDILKYHLDADVAERGGVTVSGC